MPRWMRLTVSVMACPATKCFLFPPFSSCGAVRSERSRRWTILSSHRALPHRFHENGAPTTLRIPESNGLQPPSGRPRAALSNGATVYIDERGDRAGRLKPWVRHAPTEVLASCVSVFDHLEDCRPAMPLAACKCYKVTSRQSLPDRSVFVFQRCKQFRLHLHDHRHLIKRGWAFSTGRDRSSDQRCRNGCGESNRRNAPVNPPLSRLVSRHRECAQARSVSGSAFSAFCAARLSNFAALLTPAATAALSTRRS